MRAAIFAAFLFPIVSFNFNCIHQKSGYKSGYKILFELKVVGIMLLQFNPQISLINFRHAD